mmetsp:Transcript_21564/g.52529  ORF Transcript_21564/g.52529 Transcript_21564/m.52529 type:complete len:299 (-) Transcript_21564:79-975(-)
MGPEWGIRLRAQVAIGTLGWEALKADPHRTRIPRCCRTKCAATNLRTHPLHSVSMECLYWIQNLARTSCHTRHRRSNLTCALRAVVANPASNCRKHLATTPLQTWSMGPGTSADHPSRLHHGVQCKAGPPTHNATIRKPPWNQRPPALFSQMRTTAIQQLLRGCFSSGKQQSSPLDDRITSRWRLGLAQNRQRIQATSGGILQGDPPAAFSSMKSCCGGSAACELWSLLRTSPTTQLLPVSGPDCGGCQPDLSLRSRCVVPSAGCSRCTEPWHHQNPSQAPKLCRVHNTTRLAPAAQL